MNYNFYFIPPVFNTTLRKIRRVKSSIIAQVLQDSFSLFILQLTGPTPLKEEGYEWADVFPSDRKRSQGKSSDYSGAKPTIFHWNENLKEIYRQLVDLLDRKYHGKAE